MFHVDDILVVGELQLIGRLDINLNKIINITFDTSIQHTYGIYVYAQNPDQVIYLYQFAKMVLFGAKQALECAGFINTRFSGGEISPEEMYLPENMYARVLRLQCVAPITVPRLTGGPATITAIHMHDIVVDGIRGGVTPYEAEDGDG